MIIYKMINRQATLLIISDKVFCMVDPVEPYKPKEEKSTNDKMFIAIILVIALVLIILIALSFLGFFVADDKEVPKDPTHYELDNVTYVFSGPIVDAWKFPAKDTEYIAGRLRSAENVVILFNGSSEKDNSVFSKISF